MQYRRNQMQTDALKNRQLWQKWQNEVAKDCVIYYGAAFSAAGVELGHFSSTSTSRRPSWPEIAWCV